MFYKTVKNTDSNSKSKAASLTQDSPYRSSQQLQKHERVKWNCIHPVNQYDMEGHNNNN
jgi:hypothetical protein